MSRNLFRPLVAAAAAALSVIQARADESYTTRIEPRPAYGANITFEQGVRVFRPLPSERQVIVNPGGKTPLALGFNDTRIKAESTSNNYFYDDRVANPSVGGGWGGGWGGPHVGRRPFIGHHPHFGGFRSGGGHVGH